MNASAVLVLESELLRVEVEPDHGAQVRFMGRPDGPNALAWYDWSTPVPAAAGGYGDSETDWLSRYRGGWQELFPNAGGAGEYRGVPMAFHGDASGSAWHVIEHTGDGCVLRTPTRLPLILTRSMRISAAGALLIEETVENESDLDLDYLWGHHPVFPALPGARIDMPPGARAWAEPLQPSPFGTEPQAWPNLVGGDGGVTDVSAITEQREQRLLYLEDLAPSWVALRQPTPVPSVGLAWDPSTFRDLWVWLQNGTDEFPWFGRARMLGLEPQTSSPFTGLEAAARTGRAHRIAPRASTTSWLTMTLFESTGPAVAGVQRDGTIEFAPQRDR